MKFILFCQNPYAFGILEPITQVLKGRKHSYLWFITENLLSKFPFKQEDHTTRIADLEAYSSDAILCPGNEVPHYLRGWKVQIFHGLAGEKKGHFRIRHYFDLYLTQGPYFTERFNELKKKHKNFDVIETGWPKLDIYGKDHQRFQKEKEDILEKHQAKKLILYAPTFSPSLTSAPFLKEEIENLVKEKEYLILIKFHDLMDPEIIKSYKEIASQHDNIRLEEEPNIVKFLLMADLMISDTSSVVYEFLLLNKPVVTLKNNSDNILWDNSLEYTDLSEKVATNLNDDPYGEQRLKIIKSYHPYNDGKSSIRMVTALEDYVRKNGVPERRKIPFLRRRKISRLFKK